jgi:hypothetical protein
VSIIRHNWQTYQPGFVFKSNRNELSESLNDNVEAYLRFKVRVATRRCTSESAGDYSVSSVLTHAVYNTTPAALDLQHDLIEKHYPRRLLRNW